MERTNLHSSQARYVADLYQSGEINWQERQEMLALLQEEWG